MSIQRGKIDLAIPSSLIARALLGYLFYFRGKQHDRLKLIGILMPDLPENKARRRLSQALWQIRKTLPGMVTAEKQSIGISEAFDFGTDVERFKSLSVEPGKLQDACDLYQGDFMEGLFDEWVLPLRETFRIVYIKNLEMLVRKHKTAGRYQLALDAAYRLCETSPQEEHVFREIMRLKTMLGFPHEALRYYRSLPDVCEEETIALAEEISGQVGQKSGWETREDDRNRSISLERVPLIGRQDERTRMLAWIGTIFDDADKSGGMIILEGEAGVGKTRLVQEISRDVVWRGGQVLWGTAHEMAYTKPYAPLIEALSGGLTPLRYNQIMRVLDPLWVRVLFPLFPEIIEGVPDLPPAPALTPELERKRLDLAFSRFVTAWTQFTPLLIVLENLQWMDTETLELLAGLADSLRETGCVIIGTHRDEESRSFPDLWEKLRNIDQAGLIGRLSMRRLSNAETSELIRKILGIEKPAPLFEMRLYQETQGNPLFILETLRVLYDEALLQRDKRGFWRTPWDESTTDYKELPLPPVVEQVIQRRLKRLQPDFAQTLAIAATLGAEFDFALLQSVSNLEPAVLIHAVRELVRRHFFDEMPKTYRFSHDKIRQAVYESIDPDACMQNHARIGKVLEIEHPDDAAALAYHFTKAAVWDKAILYHQKAGERAARVYDNQNAIFHYSHAIRLLAEKSAAVDPEKMYTLTLAREALFGVLGKREAQGNDIGQLEVLAERMDDDRKRARAALCRAKFADFSGDYAVAIRAARQVVDISVKLDDERIRADGLWRWGSILASQGKYRLAEKKLEKALSCAERTKAQNLEAGIHRNLGVTAYLTSRYAVASEHFHRALTIFRQIHDQRYEGLVLNNIGLVYRTEGDYEKAKEYFIRSLEVIRETGDRQFEGVALGNLGVLYGEQGLYYQAMEYCEQVLVICRENGDKPGQSLQLVNLALVLMHMGDYGNAETFLRDGLELSHKIGELRIAIFSQVYLALVLVYRDKLAEAEEFAKQALALSGEYEDLHVQGLALTFLGFIHEACAKKALADAEKQACLLDAESCYRQALEIRRELGWEHMAVEPLAGLARVAVESGNAEQAETYAEEILAFMAHGRMRRVEEPFRIRLTCYQILKAGNAQPEQKNRIDHFLRETCQQLQTQASKIEDQRLRELFLSGVRWHRQILEVCSHLEPEKITIRMPKAGVPTGRSLKDDEWVDVTFSSFPAEAAAGVSKATKRRNKLLSLLEEAKAQGGMPTVRILARVLGVSSRTVKRDLAVLRNAGYCIITRGSRDNPK